MSDLNRLILTGRLTRNPEKIVLESGRSMLRFGIATNTYRGPTREDVLFLDAALFGPRADALASILHKGMRVAVDGVLQQRNWQSADGTRHTSYSILVDRIELMDRKPGASGEPEEAPPPPVQEEVPF